MTDSSSSNVFCQVEAVLNNDWVQKSGNSVTKILDEIEKIGVREIRFHRGGHIICGDLDQLTRVQDHLLKKADTSFQMKTKSLGKNSGKLEEFFGGELRPAKYREMSQKPLTVDGHRRNSWNSVRGNAELQEIDKDGDFQSRRELMVDSDIWDFIETKRSEDLDNFKALFSANLIRAEDVSGVLKICLEPNSCVVNRDDLELMHESLASLYQEILKNCVTETASSILSDEMAEKMVDYISKKFPLVLVKKCLYNDNFLLIGPQYDAREARKEFQLLARKIKKSSLIRDDGRMYEKQNCFYSQDYERNRREDEYVCDDYHRERFAEWDKNLSNKEDVVYLVDDDDVDADNYEKDFKPVDKNEQILSNEGDEVEALGTVETMDSFGNKEKWLSRNEWKEEEKHEVHFSEKNSVNEEAKFGGDFLKMTRQLENPKLEPSPDVDKISDAETHEIARNDDKSTASKFNLELPEDSSMDNQHINNDRSTSMKKKKSNKTFSGNIPVKIVKPKLPFVVDSSSNAIPLELPPLPITKFETTEGAASAEKSLKKESSCKKVDICEEPMKKLSVNSQKEILLDPCRVMGAEEEQELKQMFRDQKKGLQRKPYDSPSSSDSESEQNVDAEPQIMKSQSFGSEKVDLKSRMEELDLQSEENIQDMIDSLVSKGDPESQRKLELLLEMVSREDNPKTTNNSRLAMTIEGRLDVEDDGWKLKEPIETPPPDTSVPLAKHQEDAMPIDMETPQPPNGSFACVIDKSFHLPGHNKCGTIEINISFETGVLEKEQPTPGRSFKAMKVKAYLPASGDGRETLRLMKAAFSARKLFVIRSSENETEDDVIVPNGIIFKDAIDQFPDPGYLPNVIDQLKRLME